MPNLSSPSDLAWREAAVDVRYHLAADGTVDSVDIVQRALMDAPRPDLAKVLIPPGEHDGTSLARAIVIIATTDISGAWERFYFALQVCDGSLPWRAGGSALISSGGRDYDRETIVSASTGEKKSMFFDVSSPMAATRKSLVH